MLSTQSSFTARAFCVVAFLSLLVNVSLAFAHSLFYYQRDIIMSPKAAVRLGLMNDSHAPWAVGLVFRKNDNGGFDYRDRSQFSFLASTQHTDLDIPAECERVGGCEVRIPLR